MNYENYETYLVTAFGPLSLHFPLDAGYIKIFCGHCPYEQKNCDASDWKNMQAQGIRHKVKNHLALHQKISGVSKFFWCRHRKKDRNS